MRVTVTQQDLDNWLLHDTSTRELPVQSALRRATGLQVWTAGDWVEIIEYDEYRRELTRTKRRLPREVVLLDHRCLRRLNPPDLFLTLPYTFEIDLP